MSDELRGQRDAVLTRYGRNLLVCQQIEVALKEVLKRSRFEGSAAALEAMLEKRAEKLRTSTLGALVEEIKESVLRSEADEDVETAPVSVPDYWVGFAYQMRGSEDFVARRVNDLDWLVSERNALAHHFLPRWSPNDPDGLQATMDFLDEQFERLEGIRADWERHLEEHLESRRLLVSFLASPELGEVLEQRWWDARPTLKALKEHVEQGARPDGWAYVSRGAELARAQAPDDVAQMRALYGVRSFTELLKAYPDFEVMDEVLPNGATRTLYRMCPGTGKPGAPDEPAPAGTVS